MLLPQSCQANVRCDVLGEPLPYEDADESTPEDEDTLLLEELALVAVHGIEELDLRHKEGVHCPGRVDEVVTRETNETVTNELGCDKAVFASDSRSKTGGAKKTYVKIPTPALTDTL